MASTGDNYDDALDAALLNAFDQRARRNGYDATMAFLKAAHQSAKDNGTHAGGRPITPDEDKRLERLAWHLQNDEDLRALGRQGKPVLTEAARRAIGDHPAPGDIAPDGTINKHGPRRLVGKFTAFCWDVRGRGWSERGTQNST